MENITNEINSNSYEEIELNEDNNTKPAAPEKMKSPIVWSNVVFGAFQITALFYLAHLLINILSLKTDGGEFLAIMICSVLSFIAIFSESVKCAALKWLLSLPITFILIVFFRASNFYVRAINWAIPDYGEPSMGGLWASGFLLICHAAASFFSLILGLGMSSLRKYIKSEKIIKFITISEKICAVISVAIVFTVMMFDISMPSYSRVYS